MKTIKKIATLCSIVFFCVVTFTVNAQHLEKTDITREPRYSIFPINNNSNLSNDECYCYFYNDFNDYHHYVNFFVLAEALSIQNQWYNEQKETIKKDLIDRVGFDSNYYHNYEDVQSAFFNDRFGAPVANYFLNNAKNTATNLRNQSLEDFNETFITSEMFELVKDSHIGGALDDFGDLTHNNKRLEDMSYYEAYDLWNNQYGAENVNHQLDWQSYSARVNKINGMLNHHPLLSPSSQYLNFMGYIGGQFRNHINSQSLSNHISLMTGYMIYEWNLQYLYSRPNLNLPEVGYNFYYPYDHTAQITTVMNSNINNAPGYSDSFNYPSMSPEEIFRRYSMTKQHLGNLAASFFEDKNLLIDEGGMYQARDNYSYRRRNMLKSLAEYFLQDESLISDNDWEGVQSWGQNSDRPEQLMNVKLSHDVLSFGFRDFGSVFEALGNYPELNAQKGALLRTYINENAPNNVDLSSFTDADLGLIFDFDDRGIDYLGLQFSDYAMSLILEIEHGDNIYGWSLFTDPFKLEALHTLVDGGQVDFEDEKILAPSFLNNSKAMCIYNILKNTPRFQNLIINTFGESSEARLKFELADLPDHIAGINIASVGDISSQTIKINKNHLNTKHPLKIAHTIIHESIHAYLKVKAYECSTGFTVDALNNQELDELLSNPNFDYSCLSTATNEHNVMFNVLIPYMQESLNDIFNNLVASEDLNPVQFFYLPSNGAQHSFTWDNALYYLSLSGLTEAQAFSIELPLGSDERHLFNEYNLLVNNQNIFNHATCN